ncbi:MAG: DNA replication/repair protein RecF [Methylomonas sp.]|jgi:DNA replication and repair protein RecF
MAILKLDVFAVRNIQSATIHPSPAINLITGANASGKSALLEAVFLLGRAKSFRTTHIRQAISFEHACLTVAAQTSMNNASVSTIGIQVDSKQYEIHIDMENRHKADLAYALPVQLIHPKSYRLLDGGPQNRREFLDWGIFNQHKMFLPSWRKFSKALHQRNVLLKSRQFGQLAAWDKELIEYGEIINRFRRQYIQTLQPVFMEMASHFLACSEIDLKFYAGWDEAQGFAQILQLYHEKDMRYGYTQYGPHRADFLTYLNKRPAKDYLSRGQQKLLVLALLLSQVKLLNEIMHTSCCILIDDLAAELDTENRLKLLKYLSVLGCQVFMTATNISDFGDLSNIQNYKMFHVEQGSIKEL